MTGRNLIKGAWPSPSTKSGTYKASLKSNKIVMHPTFRKLCLAWSAQHWQWAFKKKSVSFPKSNHAKAQRAAPTRHGSLNYVQNWKSNKLESTEKCCRWLQLRELGHLRLLRVAPMRSWSLKNNKRIMHQNHGVPSVGSRLFKSAKLESFYFKQKNAMNTSIKRARRSPSIESGTNKVQSNLTLRNC